MAERFFATRQAGGAALDPNQPPIALLSGPPSCGKTSLLFQFVINCALESSRNVVFMCSKKRLENKPPFLSQGVDPSSEVFERIQMKYVEDDYGIKKYFAGFHLHESFPAAVIIDDFGDFFSDRNCQERYGNPRGRDLAMVRTLALCQDALAHANEKLQPKEACKLLLSDTYQGDGSGSFIMKSNVASGRRTGKMRTARYSVALQYLVLEEMVDE